MTPEQWLEQIQALTPGREVQAGGVRVRRTPFSYDVWCDDHIVGVTADVHWAVVGACLWQDWSVAA